MAAFTKVAMFPDRQPFLDDVPAVLRRRLDLEPKVPRDLDALVAVVESASGLMGLTASVDMTGRRLLGEAAWRGGALDLDELLSHWASGDGPDHPQRELLEAGRRSLQRALLVEPQRAGGPWMQISRDVMPFLQLPGRSAADGLMNAVSEELLATLTAMGVKDPPRLRDERAQLLVRLMLDRAHIERVVTTLSPGARQAFEMAIDARGPLDAYQFGMIGMVPLDRRYRRSYPYGGRLGTIYELHDVGLMGANDYEREVWVWREVLQSLRPMFIRGWAVPLHPSPVPLLSAMRSSAMATPLSLLGRMLDEWRAQPPTALADGGLGVGPVRALAKRLKAPSPHVGLLAHIAIEMQMLKSSVVGTEGRGRNARPVYRWSVTEAGATWSSQPAVSRWAGLVRHWLSDGRLADAEGLPERWSYGYGEADRLPRHVALRSFEAIEPGAGVDAAAFASWLWGRWPSVFRSDVHSAAVIDALRALGLVPATGPVGLTDQARRLLAGEDVASEAEAETSGADGTGGATVFVQADRTVTVLPEASLEARLLLDRIAVLEGEAGARLYRLTESSVRAGLDGGIGVEAMLEQLTLVSGRQLPQPVEHLLRDVERTRGRLVLSAAVTVIASEDPVAIATAVRVKSAKLRALGPYTAVSSLPADKVRAALVAKNVHVMVDAEPPAARVAPRAAVPVDASAKPSTPAVPVALGYVGLRQIEELASGLRGGKRRGGGGGVG